MKATNRLLKEYYMCPPVNLAHTEEPFQHVLPKFNFRVNHAIA